MHRDANPTAHPPRRHTKTKRDLMSARRQTTRLAPQPNDDSRGGSSPTVRARRQEPSHAHGPPTTTVLSSPTAQHDR
ncbi:hypothetical protein E2562_034779 [Oryza meyeriana var. granulata]|uniref:Uncharacterized protein n=1 Tax=Oryza meyeriana var. granulata TaxID=110450 RepID=A0A6G1CLS3_9ORYZ|nr:hypothetical protein E2562_034779 [Oryza meyeriana var. granulata]